MKLGGPKIHGKLFEDDGEVVTIWPQLEDILMKYKLSFYEGGIRMSNLKDQSIRKFMI